MNIHNRNIALAGAIAIALAATPALAGDTTSRDANTAARAADTTARPGDTTWHSDTTARDSDSMARSSDSMSRDSDTWGRDSDTTARNADTTARNADTSARNADTTARNADTAARNADTTARNADASALGSSAALADARLESRIGTTYALNSHLRANDLQVSVANGTATLTGTVEEEVSKDLAAQLATGVDGITNVDNQIQVKADYKPTSQTGVRMYGAQVDDASTSAAVRSKMSWSERSGGHVATVTSVDGMVTLTGNAASEQDKQYLTRLATNTPGVRGVDNQLVIVESTDTDTDSSSITEAISDGWITTKVKSTFMYSNNVNSSDISVSTDGGVVTLTGSVSSAAERARAVELAQNIRGVTSVESSALQFTPFDEVASAPIGR